MAPWVVGALSPAHTLLAIAFTDLLPEAIVGASDLIPEMHRGGRSWRVIVVHLAGIGALVLLARLIAV